MHNETHGRVPAALGCAERLAAYAWRGVVSVAGSGSCTGLPVVAAWKNSMLRRAISANGPAAKAPGTPEGVYDVNIDGQAQTTWEIWPICVPTVGGKRGNPVLWDRRFFAEISKVEGDTGAKHLIGEHADLVCEVEMTGEAAITDIDTPEALAAWRAKAAT